MQQEWGSLIYLLIQLIFTELYYAPYIILGPGDIAVEKTDKVPALVGKTDNGTNQQSNIYYNVGCDKCYKPN